MRIIDRLMRRRKKQTPRVIKVEPGCLTIKADGCTILIHENGIDKRKRDLTAIVVTRDVDLGGPNQFQLITNPSTTAIDADRFFKRRTMAAIHVVKLKAPRKPPKRAKPGQDDAPQEPYTGAKIDKGAS